MKHGADVNKKNIEGKSPLTVGCASGNPTLIKYLVEHYNGNIFNGCNDGNLNLVKYLVEHGDNLNKEDNNGRTPLFYACEKGHENVVKYLVEQGTDVNKEDNNGNTPLFCVCEKGHENIAKYLVEHGANILKVNNGGQTPLFIANRNRHFNIGRYLIQMKASLNKEGQSNEVDKTQEEGVGKDNGKSDERIKEKGDLVIGIYDFNGRNSNELTFHKDEYLIVTNWNIRDGWATGYKRSNPFEQGNFPTILIRKCSESGIGIYRNYFIYIFFFF